MEKIPARVHLILEWLLANNELLEYSDAVKLNLHIKGTSVRGEVTILPDTKK